MSVSHAGLLKIQCLSELDVIDEATPFCNKQYRAWQENKSLLVNVIALHSTVGGSNIKTCLINVQNYKNLNPSQTSIGRAVM